MTKPRNIPSTSEERRHVCLLAGQHDNLGFKVVDSLVQGIHLIHQVKHGLAGGSEALQGLLRSRGTCHHGPPPVRMRGRRPLPSEQSFKEFKGIFNLSSQTLPFVDGHSYLPVYLF